MESCQSNSRIIMFCKTNMCREEGYSYGDYTDRKWNHKRKYATPQEVNLSTSFLLHFTYIHTVSD
jgi:hypothetical protein